MQDQKRTERKPTRKLAIGIVSMLGAFPLFLPFFTRLLAVLLFFYGLAVYITGLFENWHYQQSGKQAPAPST